MKAYFGVACCNISKNAAGFINYKAPGQLLSVGFTVDSCKALECPDAFVPGCFCSFVGTAGRGGGGDEPGNRGELSGSLPAGPERLLLGMSPARRPALSAPV